MPTWIKKLIVDFLEVGLAALFALSVAVPTNMEEARRWALLAAIALGGAFIAALRRAALPELIAWVRRRLGMEDAPE